MVSLVVLVLAQSPQAWRLTWQAPEGCTPAAGLQRALEARLGQAVFAEPADAFIEGVVVAAERGFVAKVTVTDAKGTALGQRDVTSDDPSCPAIDSRLVLVLALLVDPSGRLRTGVVTAAPAPTPALPPPTAPARLLSPEDLVHLRVESPDGETRLVELRQGRTSGDGRAWLGSVDVCGVPCAAAVRRGASLEVRGGDVLPAAFTLSGTRTDRAVVVVQPSSIARLTWSIVAVSLATTLLGLGVVGLALGANSSTGAALSVAAFVVGAGLGGLGAFGLSQGPTRVTVRDDGRD